jgi:predicted nucleic acid-binding protein
MAAIASYLADTSALARLGRSGIDAALSPLIEAGQVATCGMIEVELLVSARSPDDYSRHGLTLLHYDHEYDLIASVTGQTVRWVVPRGTADGS